MTKAKTYVMVIFLILIIFYVGGTVLPLVRGNSPDSSTYTGMFVVVILTVGVVYITKSKRWGRV